MRPEQPMPWERSDHQFQWQYEGKHGLMRAFFFVICDAMDQRRRKWRLYWARKTADNELNWTAVGCRLVLVYETRMIGVSMRALGKFMMLSCVGHWLDDDLSMQSIHTDASFNFDFSWLLVAGQNQAQLKMRTLSPAGYFCCSLS